MGHVTRSMGVLLPKENCPPCVLASTLTAFPVGFRAEWPGECVRVEVALSLSP